MFALCRGIETLVAADPKSESLSAKIALSLLIGFAFMLIIEQFLSGDAHGHSHTRTPSTSGTSTTVFSVPEDVDTSKHTETPVAPAGDYEFDVALDELEAHEGMALANSGGDGNVSSTSRANGTGIISMHERHKANTASSKKKAFPLTFGLVIHSLADGLALGASAVPRINGEDGNGGAQLTIVVFLAIVVHKGTIHYF